MAYNDVAIDKLQTFLEKAYRRHPPRPDGRISKVIWIYVNLHFGRINHQLSFSYSETGMWSVTKSWSTHDMHDASRVEMVDDPVAVLRGYKSRPIDKIVGGSTSRRTKTVIFDRKLAVADAITRWKRLGQARASSTALQSHLPMNISNIIAGQAHGVVLKPIKVRSSTLKRRSKRVVRSLKRACRSDEILNPVTGRCVKRSGKVGKKLKG